MAPRGGRPQFMVKVGLGLVLGFVLGLFLRPLLMPFNLAPALHLSMPLLLAPAHDPAPAHDFDPIFTIFFQSARPDFSGKKKINKMNLDFVHTILLNFPTQYDECSDIFRALSSAG